MKKRRLCIITGSRAEWGLFYPLAKEIEKNKRYFILQIIATGAHLSSDFGLTYREIEKDGFRIDHKVKMLFKGDAQEIIARSVSLGIDGLTGALKSLNPDLVFLLGDRFETFAAAAAAFFLKMPIAHIHGGELTEGSLDDSLRHAITKLSSLHFVSTEIYRKRVVQMGEDPERVFKVGALALDNIKDTRLLNREELEKKTNFKFGKRNIMITFNPSTAEEKAVWERQFINLLKVIDALPDTKIIFTKSNPDIHSKTITRLIDNYVAKNRDKAVSFLSMGRMLYLSALRYIDVVAGNSSSGIIEAPSFGIPTINIGSRENGRVKGDTVIDVDGSRKSVRKAFRKVFSDAFRRRCRNTKNPYGDSGAARKIIDAVKDIDVTFSKKRFLDLDFKSL